jgi:hypothetical protein
MALRTVLFGVVIAACTWFGEWWCIPLIGAAYALFRRTTAAPIEAGVGAMLAWGALFLLNAGQPAFSVLLTRLGGVFPMPGAIVLVIAALFAGLLAWSAARLVVGIAGTKV